MDPAAAKVSNAVAYYMKSALEKMETIAQQQEQPAEAPEQLTVDFAQAEAEPESEVNVTAAKVIEEIAQSQSDVPRVKAKVKKSNNRSRVGSMFDLLTFNDV